MPALAIADVRIACTDCHFKASSICRVLAGGDVVTLEGKRKRQFSLRSKRVFVHEGEAPGEVYRLQSGWSARFRVLANGDRQILTIDLPGDFLTPELLCGTPSRFSKLALTPVTLCAFPVEPTSDELYSDRDKADFIEKLLVRHIRSAEDRIMMLGRMAAASRIAALLLEIHHRLSRRGLAGEDGFDLPLRHEDIGDALGLTAAHVSRTFATLRQAGLAQIDAGRATIDRKGLAKLTH